MVSIIICQKENRDIEMSEQLEPIIIAIPIVAKIRRFCYGHFFGPCYIYYAEAMGIEVSGDSPDDAAQKLATELCSVTSVEEYDRGYTDGYNDVHGLPFSEC